MKKLYLLVISLFIVSCSSSNSFEVNYSTNLLNKNDEIKLKKLFESNNISNGDKFISWVKDYNKQKDSGCGIKTWNKTKNFSYDDMSCIQRYEKTHDVSDGNCRITAYTLIDSIVDVKKTINEHGDYLMLDFDVLETNDEYKFIDKERFTTIFNEIDVKKYDGQLKDIFPSIWKKYDIKMNSDNVYLISLVMYDPDFNLLFVGHTGVLIKMEENYLFIEKIAFEEPYQFTVIKDKNDLKDIFKMRSTYFGDEQGPFVYENDKLLFEY